MLCDLTSLRGRPDAILGWKASQGYTYHEHPCVIYLDYIGLYLRHIILYLIQRGRLVSLLDQVSAGDVGTEQVHVCSESSATSSILSQTLTHHPRVISRAWLQLLSP